MKEAILTLFLFLVTFMSVTALWKKEYKVDRLRYEVETLREEIRGGIDHFNSRWDIEVDAEDVVGPCEKIKNMKKQYKK